MKEQQAEITEQIMTQLETSSVVSRLGRRYSQVRRKLVQVVTSALESHGEVCVDVENVSEDELILYSDKLQELLHELSKHIGVTAELRELRNLLDLLDTIEADVSILSPEKKYFDWVIFRILDYVEEQATEQFPGLRSSCGSLRFGARYLLETVDKESLSTVESSVTDVSASDLARDINKASEPNEFDPEEEAATASHSKEWKGFGKVLQNVYYQEGDDGELKVRKVFEWLPGNEVGMRLGILGMPFLLAGAAGFFLIDKGMKYRDKAFGFLGPIVGPKLDVVEKVLVTAVRWGVKGVTVPAKIAYKVVTVPAKIAFRASVAVAGTAALVAATPFVFAWRATEPIREFLGNRFENTIAATARISENVLTAIVAGAYAVRDGVKGAAAGVAGGVRNLGVAVYVRIPGNSPELDVFRRNAGTSKAQELSIFTLWSKSRAARSLERKGQNSNILELPYEVRQYLPSQVDPNKPGQEHLRILPVQHFLPVTAKGRLLPLADWLRVKQQAGLYRELFFFKDVPMLAASDERVRKASRKIDCYEVNVNGSGILELPIAPGTEPEFIGFEWIRGVNGEARLRETVQVRVCAIGGIAIKIPRGVSKLYYKPIQSKWDVQQETMEKLRLLQEPLVEAEGTVQRLFEEGLNRSKLPQFTRLLVWLSFIRKMGVNTRTDDKYKNIVKNAGKHLLGLFGEFRIGAPELFALWSAYKCNVNLRSPAVITMGVHAERSDTQYAAHVVASVFHGGKQWYLDTAYREYLFKERDFDPKNMLWQHPESDAITTHLLAEARAIKPENIGVLGAAMRQTAINGTALGLFIQRQNVGVQVDQTQPKSRGGVTLPRWMNIRRWFETAQRRFPEGYTSGLVHLLDDETEKIADAIHVVAYCILLDQEVKNAVAFNRPSRVFSYWLRGQFPTAEAKYLKLVAGEDSGLVDIEAKFLKFAESCVKSDNRVFVTEAFQWLLTGVRPASFSFWSRGQASYHAPVLAKYVRRSLQIPESAMRFDLKKTDSCVRALELIDVSKAQQASALIASWLAGVQALNPQTVQQESKRLLEFLDNSYNYLDEAERALVDTDYRLALAKVIDIGASAAVSQLVEHRLKQVAPEYCSGLADEIANADEVLLGLSRLCAELVTNPDLHPLSLERLLTSLKQMDFNLEEVWNNRQISKWVLEQVALLGNSDKEPLVNYPSADYPGSYLWARLGCSRLSVLGRKVLILRKFGLVDEQMLKNEWPRVDEQSVSEELLNRAILCRFGSITVSDALLDREDRIPLGFLPSWLSFSNDPKLASLAGVTPLLPEIPELDPELVGAVDKLPDLFSEAIGRRYRKDVVNYAYFIGMDVWNRLFVGQDVVSKVPYSRFDVYHGLVALGVMKLKGELESESALSRDISSKIRRLPVSAELIGVLRSAALIIFSDHREWNYGFVEQLMGSDDAERTALLDWLLDDSGQVHPTCSLALLWAELAEFVESAGCKTEAVHGIILDSLDVEPHVPMNHPGQVDLALVPGSRGDFFEFRDYEIGDDNGDIDWVATATNRRLTVRVNECPEARDVHVVFAADGINLEPAVRSLCELLQYLSDQDVRTHLTLWFRGELAYLPDIISMFGRGQVNWNKVNTALDRFHPDLLVQEENVLLQGRTSILQEQFGVAYPRTRADVLTLLLVSQESERAAEAYAGAMQRVGHLYKVLTYPSV